MTSPVDIVNIALSQCGSQSTISSFTEGSPVANIASLLYQTKINSLARSAHWNCLRKQALLTQLKTAVSTTGTINVPPIGPPQPWLFEYEYPPDCLAARYIPVICQPSIGPSPPLTTGNVPNVPALFISYFGRYAVGTDTDAQGTTIRVILSETYQAQLVYTARIDDPDLWDPHFLDAATATLAAWFVNPLARNRALMADNIKVAEALIRAARVSDGDEGVTVQDNIPDFIMARFAMGPSGWGQSNWGQYYGQWSQMGFPDGSLF